MATARYLCGFGTVLDWRPLEFVEHLPDIRICNLCGVVSRFSKLLPCSHVFCKSCFGQLKLKDSTCPVDKKAFVEDQVLELELTEGQLNDRVVLCVNSSRGCTFMGKLVDFMEHIKSDCDYFEVTCPKCGRGVPQMRILEHSLGSCLDGTLMQRPTETGSVLDELRKIKVDVEAAMSGMSLKKAAIQDKVNDLVESFDGYAKEMKALQEALKKGVSNTQLAKVHIPSAVPGRATGGGVRNVVHRVYVCLDGVYKRKALLCGAASASELSPACVLAGYTFKLQSKFVTKDDLVHLELGVAFCAGSWDSFVAWPFGLQVILTLVHPVDERKSLTLAAWVPGDTGRFECVKKPSPESSNVPLRARPVGWNQLELTGFVANDSLCVAVEFE
ncbi:uncharacterized protein LOC144180368 [Haemaphysalis longicornis]